jgi:hypothetical protein
MMKNTQTTQHFLKAAIDKTLELRSVLFLVSMTVVSLNLLEKPAFAGGFARSCKDLDMGGGRVISATCKDRNANFHTSVLDLNRRIGNRDGNLTTSGGFVGTCKNVRLDGTTLQADCLTFNKDFRFTRLDLNSVITNNDGNLTFDR